MDIGLALGLTRFRVFDLDRDAYLVWLWVGSAFLVIRFDFAFLYLLRGQSWASLSLARLVASIVQSRCAGCCWAGSCPAALSPCPTAPCP